MAVSRHPVIAREGWNFIFFSSLLVSILQQFVSMYFAILWIIPVVLLWLYRDPYRSLPSDPLAIVSPVDGTITLAEPHPDPYLGRDAYLFRIAMSLSDVFSIRSATEGKIIQQWLDQEDADDERSLAHAIQVRTDENDDIMIVLRPGRFLKQLSCDAVIGQRIGQGHRCGIIPFGAEVDVYLPATSTIKARLGDRVEAGSSVLATLKHHI